MRRRSFGPRGGRNSIANNGLGVSSTVGDPVAPTDPAAERERRPSRGTVGLDRAIGVAAEGLIDQQAEDGHWRFDLEADPTIPAEYILMNHFLGEVDRRLEGKFAVYLREKFIEDGWHLYPGGPFDLSCSVKAYWALKLTGEDPDRPHMTKAREAILARGGAAKANVFTRITLALFEQLPWRAVPFVPVEILLLPRWSPFHLTKISYWSRAVLVPLTILCSLRARARNPLDVSVGELFSRPPEEERDYFPVRGWLNRVFLGIERAASKMERLIPPSIRRAALKRAEQWVIERANGIHGLGAIFPAMVNGLEALAVLGYPPDQPHRTRAREALRRLVVEGEDRAYCQPCVSPVWDSALASLALRDTEPIIGDLAAPARERALDWLARRQVRTGDADWREARSLAEPGGWPFQYENSHYPDLDDTSAVAWAMHEDDPQRWWPVLDRAADWMVAMQSSNGGFASFDVDNTQGFLNEIPFADHGALIDPPTADVSARCALFLLRMNREKDRMVVERCLDFVYRSQEPDGSWYGRWGTNYIYGIWSVLTALERVSGQRKDQAVSKAVGWLESKQRGDGGWGESNDTYFDPTGAGSGARSTAHQTAWALLALIAAGEADGSAVGRGVDYLIGVQGPDGFWHDEEFTSPGFPRVFFLKYHGYSKYFPLWALAQYRRKATRAF